MSIFLGFEASLGVKLVDEIGIGSIKVGQREKKRRFLVLAIGSIMKSTRQVVVVAPVSRIDGRIGKSVAGQFVDFALDPVNWLAFPGGEIRQSSAGIVSVKFQSGRVNVRRIKSARRSTNFPTFRGKMATSFVVPSMNLTDFQRIVGARVHVENALAPTCSVALKTG